jgi:phosphoribosyl-ATP pyrophosphohydrolase
MTTFLGIAGRMKDNANGKRLIEDLYEVIRSRKGGDPEKSHTAKLFRRGTKKIAQKVGEEAVEALIEAMAGDREKLAEESADLIYHLLVLWADQGVKPEQVFEVLEKRRGISGIEVKAARKAKQAGSGR